MTRAFLHLVRSQFTAANRLLRSAEGSAILEFAIAVPLLVVFVVGIFDFGGAFNQKQKIEQAAQEAAILAASQPTSDLDNPIPDSLKPVVTAVINSLLGSNVINSSSCAVPVPSQVGLTWTYTIGSCSTFYPSSNLVVAINRGWVCSSGTPCSTAPPAAVGTTVTVTYPYNWRFNSVIQILFPGGTTYQAITQLSEAATVHNQM